MSQRRLPPVVVGSEFALPQPALPVASSHTLAQMKASTAAKPSSHQVTVGEFSSKTTSLNLNWLDFLHRHSVIVFASLLLLVGTSGTLVARQYMSQAPQPSTISQTPLASRSGPNTSVRTAELNSRLKNITNQSLSIKMGSESVAINAADIKSWLQVVSDKNTGVSYIHVKQTAIQSSLKKLAHARTIAPVNQVSLAGSGATITYGRNGSRPADTTNIAAQISKNLLAGKGMQFSLPTTPIAFRSVTTASFAKLLEVNLYTKQMYAYESGKLIRQFPISAGAPATPTPIGQFQIYQKLPVQDMRGLNADGVTRYFQPQVKWVNYFLPGGYAVHGNYWRPLSWFGAVNSSHGCVSLPDYNAKWVYDWAPVGTTVITHV